MAEKKKSPKLDPEEMPEKKLEVNIQKAEEISEEDRIKAAEAAIREEQNNTDIKPSNPIIELGTEKGRETGEEKYTWVIFQSRSNPIDTVNVPLTVNGECLVVKRNERVPMPERFLECADHTRQPHYTQEPGDTRKVVTWIKTYGYERLGPATREDFEKFRREGTKATREQLAREGTTEG